jgi:hypothetical protein
VATEEIHRGTALGRIYTHLWAMALAKVRKKKLMNRFFSFVENSFFKHFFFLSYLFTYLTYFYVNIFYITIFSTKFSSI